MPGEPPEIIQLPEAVANQIAAGEVVERPAAVVKELAENSLDAGATRVTVRIADGGRRLVEVEDDGHGMRPEDLRRALGRHATSKLRSADDLFRIATLGFRGEALPSIAAVSELELVSRPHAAPGGWRLALAGGQETAFAPCAAAPGTRIAVRNLFWNVPARLKFLKSEASEAGHVTDQVLRLALSHPQTAFRLESQDEAVLDLPGAADLAQRIRALFGAGFADGLLPVASAGGAMEVTGFVAHPREAKPTSKRQYLFLNGRFVRDKLLLAAVREGFKGFLEPRLHGAVVLHLDLDPARVDVNVHPTKAEVRFRSEGEVFALVSRAIQAALTGAERAPTPLLDAAERAGGAVVQRIVVKPAQPPPAPVVVVQERFLPPEPPPVAPGAAQALPPPPRPARAQEPAPAYQAAPPPSPVAAAPAAFTSPRIRQVVQLADTFLLIETDRGIRLVDQHALHEKALLALLDPAVGDAARDGRQELLVPRLVDLAAHEVAAVKPHLADLAGFGIEAEVFGPTQLAVRAHPPRLKRLDWVRFFADLAADGAARATAALRERFRHRAACHAAVKAGQRLSPDEQRELAELLFRVDGLEHCPHGRPTTLDLTFADLAKRFQR
jgi:DNA mismatch repair protein MutL